jgi:hypothetical protein
MSDNMRFFGADAQKVCCAAGHPAVNSLATKTFDCNMDDYYVFEGRLYVCKRDVGTEDPLPTIDNDELALTYRKRAAKVDFTGEADVYTHCETCDPVIFEREDLDRTDHRHVWFEWRLLFEHGRLVRVEPIRLETRESLRRQMLRDGAGVLPDDDRIARKHIKQLREGRRRFW